MIKQFQTQHGLIPDGIVGPLTMGKMLEVFPIPDKNCLAHFLGQTAHESIGFKALEENLSYTAGRLVKVWPKRFANIQVALEYERNPEKLANFVYSRRMGNGSLKSGEGYKFRGRGPLQLTGKNNYKAFGESIGVDLVSQPELVKEKYGFESALWYFEKNNLWDLCQEGVTKKITKKVTLAINGGINGLSDRYRKTQFFKKLALRIK